MANISPGAPFHDLIADFAAAFRSLRRHRTFSAMAFAVAALPIAVVSTVFTAFNGLYLDALPYPSPDRLVSLRESVPATGIADIGVSRAILVAWRKSNRSFESISLYQEDGGSLSGPGREAIRLKGATVTWDLGKTLGIAPILGRDFAPEDDRKGAPCVMLAGYDLWRTSLQASRDAIGTRLTIDDAPCTVIGILPPAVIFPARSEYWIPMALPENDPSMAWDGVGRLKPGIAPSQARTDLLRIDTAAPRFGRQRTAPIVEPIRERFLGRYHSVFRLLFAAAALVLLTACANLAGLFFARGAVRRREFAIRTAVGARGYRLARQIFIEAFVLAALAGVAGAALGWLGLHIMAGTAPDVMPSWVRFNPDWRVLLAAIAAISLVTILSALGPALATSRIDLRSSLASVAPVLAVSNRLIGFMIAGEVAFATVLLASASLVIDDARRVLAADSGYQPAHTMTFGVNPPYYSDPARLQRFYEGLLSGLRATTGIDSAAGATWLPPDDPFHQASALSPEGTQATPQGGAPLTSARTVTSDYFRAMGIPIVEGREFNRNEPGRQTIVISESLARRFWPGSSRVVGKRVVENQRAAKPFTVIGVARDVRQYGMESRGQPFAYFPPGNWYSVQYYFVVRGSLDPRSMIAAARLTVRRQDPGLAIYDVQSLEDRTDRSLGPRRAWTLLFSVFGIAGLALAAAGVYGVISYSVSRRTREIGIRIALGSRTDALAASVLRQCLGWASAGVAAGVAGSWAASQIMSRILSETRPTNLAARLIAAAILMAVALLAALGPALRAAAVDPIVALRSE